MVRPILACENPYKCAEEFINAGWTMEFSQPPESGDPLVGISLFDNSFLLGITDGYVKDDEKQHIGCGVVFYLTVPKSEFDKVFEQHKKFCISSIEEQIWGDTTFEAVICGFKFMITSR